MTLHNTNSVILSTCLPVTLHNTNSVILSSCLPVTLHNTTSVILSSCLPTTQSGGALSRTICPSRQIPLLPPTFRYPDLHSSVTCELWGTGSSVTCELWGTGSSGSISTLFHAGVYSRQSAGVVYYFSYKITAALA